MTVIYYAFLNANNVCTDYTSFDSNHTPEFLEWVKTSVVKAEKAIKWEPEFGGCGPGFTWNEEHQYFVPPNSTENFIWDWEKKSYVPSIPKPESPNTAEGWDWGWDHSSVSWIQVPRSLSEETPEV